ncbi:MAG: alpha-ketoacid dehydrogenase subunit beta [Deltaproteobacteria bacterium]|nr:alpha-ketoacid dehydrogenase subunit beta [Deltaproteobacteria bacterium]
MPWTKVYLDKEDFEKASKLADQGLRGFTYRDAIKEALTQMLEKDESVFVMGEGIDDPGGTFGTTTNLHKKFGAERVFDIPIAENGMTGVAIGAALAGMKPVFVHMRVDFLPMCMDQIINHAAKWHYMFGGKVNVPLVIRSIIGRGWGSAAQHSQSLQALFAHIPGLKVVMPSTPYDAKGLLIASIEDGNPIIFIEHRWLYEQIGHVPEKIYTVPIGKGIVRKEGKDVTIAATSFMVYEAMKAAAVLEKDGINVEVVDLRTLKPLDEDIICESVKKTGRLIVADTGWKTCGIGAEVVATVAEKALKYHRRC